MQLLGYQQIDEQPWCAEDYQPVQNNNQVAGDSTIAVL